MNTEPYGVTTFCDDIRFEMNGKLTLVGCYSNELNFSGPPPGLLPVFAALVNIRIPINVKFKSIKIRIIKEEGGDVSQILEAEINAEEEKIETIVENEELDDVEERIISLTFPCRWSPLSLKEEGFLKVRAYIDEDQEIRLGALKINFPIESNEKEKVQKGKMEKVKEKAKKQEKG